MSKMKYLEMEDIAYKEWSDHLDFVASSRASPWLPAYGYHPPSPVQEIFQTHPDPFSSDNSSVGQQQYLALETIVEETSDDLCSESDRSGPTGWNSDSDTDSVIHMPKTSEHGSGWREREANEEVPKKRRCRVVDRLSLSDDEEPHENIESTSVSSRSSSLLAFESLEKHCEDVFVTTATSDPFGCGFGSDGARWARARSPEPFRDDPESSDEEFGASSSVDTLHRSASSHGSFRSSLPSDGRLRSYRSFDSLNLFEDSTPLTDTVAELSQSQSALDFEKAKEQEQEFVIRDKKLTATTADLSVVADSYDPGLYSLRTFSPRRRRDAASFHYKESNGPRKKKSGPPSPERKRRGANGTTSRPSSAKETEGSHEGTELCLGAPPPSQASVENLSEDSGFDDLVSARGKATPPGLRNSGSSTAEDERSSPSELSSASSHYSDCNGGEGGNPGAKEQPKWANRSVPASKADEGRERRREQGREQEEEQEPRGILAAADDVEVNFNPGRSSAHMFDRAGEEALLARGEVEKAIATPPVTFASLDREHSNGSFSDADVRPRPEFITFCKGRPRGEDPPGSGDRDSKLKCLADDRLRKSDDFFYGAMSAKPEKNGGDVGRKRLPVLSTPNLFVGDEDFFRSVPSAASSLTHVPLKSYDGDEADEGGLRNRLPDFGHLGAGFGGSQGASGIKGVHFCPVVSEVSWQDSYSEDSSTAASSDPSTDELSNRSLEELCKMENEEEEEFHAVEEKSIPRGDSAGGPGGPGTDGARPAEEEPRAERPVPPPGRGTPTSWGHVGPGGPAQAAAEGRPRLSVSESSLPTRDHASDARRESDHYTSTGSVAAPPPGDAMKKSKSRFGGFFERFSFRKRKSSGSGSGGKKQQQQQQQQQPSGKKDQRDGEVVTVRRGGAEEDVTVIPLRGPESEAEVKEMVRSVVTPHVVSAKPPLPPHAPRMSGGPRKRSPPCGTASVEVQDEEARGNGNMPGVRGPVSAETDAPLTAPCDADARDAPVGLLETDLDTHVTVESAGRRPPAPSNVAANKKARSLMNLGLGDASAHGDQERSLPPGYLEPPHRSHGSVAVDDRAKSMEFLLDKENQAAVLPPENELQKGGTGERIMSEHQLRVQRSLQKLNIPEWYKSSAVAQTPQGFLLKRDSRREHQGWPGLGSKTTSLSSLGSSQSATARSPTSHVLSPSPTPHLFTRWSTSRLNSGMNSSSTSPSGSARSSFNYRQPYLGWRSQEKLTRPRTPAERLAAGLLPLQKQQNAAQYSSQTSVNPNLSDVRTSIKEVTSAIVHYVSGVQENGSKETLRSQHAGTSPSPSPKWQSSPRGSSGRLCWLESSFVGSRPLDQPETPLALSEPSAARTETRTNELYLDLKPRSEVNHVASHRLNERSPARVRVSEEEQFERAFDVRARPGPASTTLDDILESLLGLPPTSRSPSPGPASAAASSPGRGRPLLPLPDRQRQRRSCGDIRGDVPGSASDPGDASFAKEVTAHRRKSEGGGPEAAGLRRQGSVEHKHRARGATDGREDAKKDHHPNLTETLVKCRYSKCGKTATVLDAKKTFKTCHNCSHVYCSRECRRAHWERHKRTCLHSRVGALCRQVLAGVKDDPKALHHLSLLARRGYLTHGRGAVKVFFSSPDYAEKFVARGFDELGEPAYVKWSDLLPAEMGADLFAELMKICKSYNPDTRLVLYVAICVVSEVPTTGAVKWERQLVSRCCKLQLDKSLVPPKADKQVPPPLPPRRSSSESASITREMDDPDTLILTSLPGIAGKVPERKVREITFANIQRELKQRGVSLRRQFPEVYKKLCSYVEGTSEHFTPATVYPRDAVSGKTFMCIIMPDSEPEKLELLPKDSTRVQTIDVSLERKPT